MPEVRGADCLAAWQEGAKAISANGGEVFNLITSIDNPTALPGQWYEAHSPHTVVRGSDRLVDVVNTVFPYKLSAKSPDRPTLYRDYLQVHARAMRLRRNRSRWGTYFARLINFAGKENQLETAIEKLSNWPRYTAALVFHLSSPTEDRPRTRGGPCWHFGELLWRKDDSLDLVAVYRNHDFFNKALGNFIALGQLLSFIAAQSGKAPGSVVCHSVHAYSQESIPSLRTLAKI